LKARIDPELVRSCSVAHQLTQVRR
jgi:hypothetical protein